MDWIKKNPAKLTLGIVALLVITATVILWTKVSAFDSNFDVTRNMAMSTAPVEKLNTEALDAAGKAMEMPVKWEPAKDTGKLFVSKLYVLHDGRLEQSFGKMFHPPVPNDWLNKYGLNVLSSSVLTEDPDGDGFTTLEEWNGLDALSHLDSNGQPVMGADGQPLPADSTDPKDPNSHPAYHTKLELVRIVYVPFRLQLMSYDLDPRNPAKTTVAINTIDRGKRTQFLEIGQDIAGTNFKVESFKQKEVPGADGTTRDASEVTVINKETGEKVVVPLKQIVDSPDSYGIFRYKWVKPGSTGKPTPDFPKRRSETFSLPPDADKTYKLIEIKGRDAVIELPDGTKKILTAP